MATQVVNPVTSINTDHEDMIHDAQMDYYGRLLATCSSDRSVKIYEVTGESYKLIADLRGHEGPIWQVRLNFFMLKNSECGDMQGKLKT